MQAILNTTYFDNTLIEYLIFFAIIIGFLIIGRIIFFISKNFLRKKAAKTKSKLDDIIIESMEKPLTFLMFIIGLIIAFNMIILSPGFEKLVSNVVKILLTIDIFWFIIFFLDSMLDHYLTPMVAKSKSDLDDVILPLIRKFVKYTLIILAFIIIIDNFGYNVTSLIAGLGIGGLAFALAAKDMLANFFGGISIITDKPFKIGDRIKIDGFDGWVREIGLRSTKIETLDGFQLIVPNAKIADSILENVSRESARKVKMTIGVEYSTSMKKMEEAKKILEDVILKNPDTENRSIVSFNEFADSSLNFLVIYWIKNLDNILGAKNNLNMAIKKRFEKAKIEMAFPTRTVYLKK